MWSLSHYQPFEEVVREHTVKVVALSDTHNRFPEVPNGALLIHAGDATMTGTLREMKTFVEWMESLPHTYKVFVAGNHDFLMEGPVGRALVESAGIIYLQDEGTLIEGLSIWGSPWTPRFGNWAFMKPQEAMEEVWHFMPDALDILITHGPPWGVLDEAPRGEGVENVGCERLVDYVETQEPRYHVFGHIHAAHGSMQPGFTHFFNVAICDEAYQPVHLPTTFEVK